MGGNARAEIRPFSVRNTLQNLRSSLFGEQVEIDSLYPAFLERAQANWDMTAARTFTWAMEAEKSHARLYSDAVTAFEKGQITHWTLADLVLYVCTVCGYMAKTQEADNCPVCNFIWDRFEVIR